MLSCNMSWDWAYNICILYGVYSLWFSFVLNLKILVEEREKSSQVPVFLVKVFYVCRAIWSFREGVGSDKRHPMLKKLMETIEKKTISV